MNFPDYYSARCSDDFMSLWYSCSIPSWWRCLFVMLYPSVTFVTSFSWYTNDLSLIVTCYMGVSPAKNLLGLHSDFWEFVGEHALFKDWQQDTREDGAGKTTSGKSLFFKSWALERAHVLVCWRSMRKYSCDFSVFWELFGETGQTVYVTRLNWMCDTTEHVVVH